MRTHSWLRAEGLAAFLAALLLYRATGHGWLMFVVALLAPDLSILGYLGGARIGALIYNLGHTYVTPAAVAAAGFLLDHPVVIGVALVWVAHIGLDRALGFGLKLPSGFHDTHLGPIGSAVHGRPV